MTPEEIQHMENTILSKLEERSKDPIWQKAFAEYNKKIQIEIPESKGLSIRCGFCYSKVHSYFKKQKPSIEG